MTKSNEKDVIFQTKDVTPSPDRFNPSNTIYVRESKGRYQRLRRNISAFLILSLFIVPWINYHGEQAVILDFFNGRKLVFFDAILYPQDFIILSLVLIIAAYTLFFFTTFLGRIWCGYTCPQTVWTFLFIWFEEKLEGSANKRKKQDSHPLTTKLKIRKTIKHLCWLTISFLCGLSFVGLFIPIRELATQLIHFEASFIRTFWVFFFTFITYLSAGWFRSIVCIHMCPYARFQSAMFDKDTLTVSYNEKRGEQRGPRSRKASPQELEKSGLGDCIDCNLCVDVCPSGIDIRQGLQYECINCGACVDACDQTMQKMNYAPGLISYTSEHTLDGKQSNILRPRLVGYGLVLLIMFGVLIYQAINIQPLELTVIRDRQALTEINSDQQIENSYMLKVINKSHQARTLTIQVEGLDKYELITQHSAIEVGSGEVISVPVTIAVEQGTIDKLSTTIYITISDNDGNDQKILAKDETRFIKAL